MKKGEEMLFTIKEDFKTFTKKYPVTVSIIAICMLITIAITILGGYTKPNLIFLGAYDKELITSGQFWRLLTYSFNHMSYPHFILNIVFLILLSHPLERTLGKIKFIMIFLFTSIFAGVIIHFFSNVDYIAGSSGFGYGLLGIYIFLFLKYKNKFDQSDRKFIFLFIAIGFTMTLLIPGVSFAGHLGGFIGGIIFAALVFRSEEQVIFYG